MSAIYFIAALVAIVWGAIFLLRGSLVGGCLAYLLVAACFGYEFLHFTVGPVPLTLDRVALAILLAAYLVQRWLGHTASTGRRKPSTFFWPFSWACSRPACFGAQCRPIPR